MIDIRKLNPNIDNTVAYIGSDFHFGHTKEFIWGSRGFKSVIDHDRSLSLMIQQQISTNADEKDKPKVLISLGDFTVGCTQQYAFEQLLNVSSLFDEIFYVFGNHEGQIKKNLRDHGGCPVELLKTIPRHYHEMPNPIPQFYFKLKNIHFVGFELMWNNVYGNEGVNLLFTHFPVTVFEDSNLINIHGHIHSTHEIFTGGNIDMGVENALYHSHRQQCLFKLSNTLTN